MHFYRSFDVNKFEHLVFEKVNEERVKHGLKPLIWDERLYRAAKHHAEWMAGKDCCQHEEDSLKFRKPLDRARFYGFRGRIVGENVHCRPYFGSEEVAAEETVEAWMKSPGHRRNMLNPRYSYAAVAAAKTENGIYVVLLLGG